MRPLYGERTDYMNTKRTVPFAFKGRVQALSRMIIKDIPSTVEKKIMRLYWLLESIGGLCRAKAQKHDTNSAFNDAFKGSHNEL